MTDTHESGSSSPSTFEELLWPIAAGVFPLLVWKPAYDSFHEPKWLALTALVGVLLASRAIRGPRILAPRTPLDLPLGVGLVATFLSLRWEAGDRWVAFFFWSRLVLGYLFFRLCVTWLAAPGTGRSERVGRLQNALAFGGAAVALLAILQDWAPAARWSQGPVSDWRFHLSSTLGNPNEVGGYLSYLLPVLVARWFGGSRGHASWIWGILLLLYLYALTTVFTVGAWLGLFVILPMGFAFSPVPLGISRWRKGWTAAVAATSIFLVLQGTLRFPNPPGRILVFFLLAALSGFGVWFSIREYTGEWKRRVYLGLAGLLVVWGALLLPWGIPNHPEGLVEEAVSSPRWRGGFGARRFIWQTTGLMVKDHPIRGIGWGRYYTVHALYQGEVYRQRDLPHDRPTVGLVPQAHSDPLQFLAESGPLGLLSFGWIVSAAFVLGFRRLVSADTSDHISSQWAAWAGLGLIVFHCLVDFPLRQPQAIFLAALSLALLAAPLKSPGVRHASPISIVALVVLGLLVVAAAAIGLRDQTKLKSGFESLSRSGRTQDAPMRAALLDQAESALDGIWFPIPETHDRWIYRAQIAIERGDFPAAENALRRAANYRHGLSLYETWLEIGTSTRDARLSLEAVKGMLRYNPCWAPFHADAARLARLLGEEEVASRRQADAEKFKVQ